MRKRSRNAAIGHTGALRARQHAVLPSPSGDPVHHLRVVRDDRDRHVVAGALARDDRRRLMVAQEDDHELVVAVALHERDDRAQRVLDRMAVGGASALGVAEERGPRGLLRREAVEDRAVADVVPGDEPGDARPRRVARDEVDLGEERWAVALGELKAVQGQEDVLVGHRGHPEARAAVADVAAVVELVVVVEGRAFRPGPLVRRIDTDRTPPCTLERHAEGEAVAPDELVVAPLRADPNARLQGGVRQPAEPAESRRREERAARGEAARPQLRSALAEHGVDTGREGRALDRDLPVALDEQEEDVLAAQAGQEPIARSGAEAVAGDLAGEDLVSPQARPYRLHLADCEGRSARGGDRRAEDAEDHPGDAEHGDRAERPVAVAGRDPCQAQQRRDRKCDEHEPEYDCNGDDEVPARPADRVAQRLDADSNVARVRDGVERPVEGREEPHVEDLHYHEHRQHRAQDHGQHSPRGGGQQDGQRDDDEELEGEPRERAEREVARLVRRDDGHPDDQQGEDRERQAVALGHPIAGGFPVAPQPPHALAERCCERCERSHEQGLRRASGEDPGGRHRQHDPLRRRDDLAPAARRQRRAHPRQQPLAGEEQVARRPNREHPRAGRGRDVDAEGEDQERIDLAVEARAERGRRPRAPRQPAVGQVQRERDGGERDKQRDRRGARERVRGQRGDADGERGPRDRHP